jgi:hypothetical protein
MAFYTIYPRPRLSRSALQMVLAARGRQVYSRVTPRELLRTAGFAGIVEQDVTAAFGATARRWLRAWIRHGDPIRARDPAQFEQEQRWRRQTLEVIDRGWLRRGLFVARKPG